MAEQGWQQVRGNAADIYDRHLVPAMFAPWVPTLLEWSELQPGQRVLDVACGSGIVARAAAERAGPSGRVVGLDINGSMLAVARSLPSISGAAIEWIEASALDMPLPDAAFDVVLCQHGLQQFPDRSVALAEMRRVLAPGGRLALCVWSRLDGSPGMAALVDALARHVSAEAASNRRAPFALSDASELRGLLVDAGFSDVRVDTMALTARFPSPEALVDYQLAATPLAALGGLTVEAHASVQESVRAAMQPFLTAEGLAVPMEAHVAVGRR